MKNVLLILFVLLLTACGDDIADLQEYTSQIKASAKTNIEPMPKVEKFESFNYSVSGLRSPFVEPEPELIQDKLQQTRDCLQPNFRRVKQPLERYPLDNLSMRGTLGGSSDTLWALVQASDGALYRVKNGNYVGLFHGKIVRVSSEQLDLQEMIPDGNGCWEVRLAQLTMSEQDDTLETKN